MKQSPVDRWSCRSGWDPPSGRRSNAPGEPLAKWALFWALSVRHRLASRLPGRRDDRGDVPGWVLVTLMTAGLVLTLWAVAGPRLEEVFNDAMDRVVGGP
jgi:hypothetical protein